MKMKCNLNGFTIIEVLVVVVIIAIIAAITLAVYSGVTKNAYDLSLKSDLSGAAETLKTFKAMNNSYPTTISCVQQDDSTNACIKSSDGNSYISYTMTANTFTLVEKNNPTGLMYKITESISQPVAVAGAL